MLMNKNSNLIKKVGLWAFLLLVIFSFFTVTAVVSRNLLLIEGEDFGSWTYESKSPVLNVWTSWDSGFYHDIVVRGYESQRGTVNVAEVDVPSKTWLKVFTGYLEVGENRYPLPAEKSKISNVVFILGSSAESQEVPLYSVDSGIPYCSYTGPIDFDRDVLTHREALSNPQACGNQACEKVFLTYYDSSSSQVIYQEYFDSQFFDRPKVTIGSNRPFGFDSVYEGFGCREITSNDLKSKRDITYEQKFTSFPFAPLYPYLARLGGFVFGDNVLSGLVISFVSTLIACVFLYLFAREYLDKKASFVVLAFILFPGAFFNLTFQPISLIAMAFFACLYFASKKRILFLGLSLLLLMFSGPYYLGVLVLFPVLVLLKNNTRRVLAVLSVLLGLLGRIFYLYKFTGDYLTLFKAHSPWFGGTSFPPLGFLNYLTSMDLFKLFEISVFLLLVILGSLKLLRSMNSDVADFEDNGQNGNLPKDLSLSFIISFCLYPFFNGGFGGVLKYYFLMVPLFFTLGSFLERNKWGRWVFFILSLSLNVVFFALWTTSSRFVI